jgi:hypothetical protein
MSLVSVAGLASAISAVTFMAIEILLYLVTETDAAGSHFEFLPATLATLVVGLAVWAHHRSLLGPERTNAVRSYGYSMAALGLLTAVGGAVGLSTAALGPDDLVGQRTEAAIIFCTTLVAGAIVWLLFWRRAEAAPQETEAPRIPRRFYLVGGSILFGLASAGALIGTLVVLFQRLLDGDTGDTLVVQASLFVFAGLATWHLLSTNSRDRDLIRSKETLTPFDVTLICSHPGKIADEFPSVAKLKVVYRDDDEAVIDGEMAAAIVEAVGNRPSIVWVDSDGFRVAPAR